MIRPDTENGSPVQLAAASPELMGPKGQKNVSPQLNTSFPRDSCVRDRARHDDLIFFHSHVAPPAVATPAAGRTRLPARMVLPDFTVGCSDFGVSQKTASGQQAYASMGAVYSRLHLVRDG